MINETILSLREHGDFNSARKVCEDSLILSPRILLNYANVCIDLEDYIRAIVVLEYLYRCNINSVKDEVDRHFYEVYQDVTQRNQDVALYETIRSDGELKHCEDFAMVKSQHLYNNSAALLLRLKNQDGSTNTSQAEHLLRQAIQLSEKEGDEDTRLQARSNLAESLACQGRLEEAANLLQSVIYDRESNVSEIKVHLDRGICMLHVRLSSFCLRLLKYDEALILCERGVQGLEDSVGQTHVFTLESYSVLASILLSQGEVVAAYVLFEKVYEGFVLVFGNKHPKTIEVAAIMQCCFEDPIDVEDAPSEYNTLETKMTNVVEFGNLKQSDTKVSKQSNVWL